MKNCRISRSSRICILHLPACLPKRVCPWYKVPQSVKLGPLQRVFNDQTEGFRMHCERLSTLSFPREVRMTMVGWAWRSPACMNTLMGASYLKRQQSEQRSLTASLFADETMHGRTFTFLWLRGFFVFFFHITMHDVTERVDPHCTVHFYICGCSCDSPSMSSLCMMMASSTSLGM